MTIQHWPTTERPREKLLEHGASQLSDAELLAILFGNGIQGKSAVDLARDVLNRFQGLRGLLNARFNEFCQVPGLGLAKYCQCQAAIELSRRQLAETLKRGQPFNHPEQIKLFLKAVMRDHRQEVFASLFLDNRHQLIAFEKLFYGTIHMTNVHPRILVERSLHHNAAAVILAHNHPSGRAEPSSADRTMTMLIKKALALIDVRLLDHCIVGDQQVISLAERGWLA